MQVKDVQLWSRVYRYAKPRQTGVDKQLTTTYLLGVIARVRLDRVREPSPGELGVVDVAAVVVGAVLRV